MNSEISDYSDNARAIIFFDALCPSCLSARRRLGPIFERRGFLWRPLQTPGSAERLAISQQQLLAAMWVLPRHSPPLGGLDAWIWLMRHVWWLKPIAYMLSIPGIKHLARGAYAWLARHRYCLTGKCQLSPFRKGSHNRHSAFLELP